MTKTFMIKGKILNNFNTINCKSNVATGNHTTTTIIIINTVTISYYNNNNIGNTNNIYTI